MVMESDSLYTNTTHEELALGFFAVIAFFKSWTVCSCIGLSKVMKVGRLRASGVDLAAETLTEAMAA